MPIGYNNPFSSSGDNPFLDIAEEKPELAFLSHLDEKGYGSNKRNRMRGLFDDAQSHFLSRLGSMIRSGESPNLRFNDFMKNDYNFDRAFGAMSPYQQGTTQGQFTPRVRHLLRF